MKRLLITALIIFSIGLYAPAQDSHSTRKERNHIRAGNKAYNKNNFAEAEVAYRKAIEENMLSEAGRFNLAASLIRQSGNADPNNEKDPVAEATNILKSLATGADDKDIAQKSYYDLGNIAFNAQNYQEAINMYKGCLRINPDNDQARENLRLAQQKLQEQQNNQDKKQDKNDQQKNQDKQEQDKQNENKDEQNNNDQNKDEQNKQDNEEEQGNKEKNDKSKEDNPRQQQGGISDANAAKILKTMENEENATRKKVQELKKREEEQSSRRRTGNQW